LVLQVSAGVAECGVRDEVKLPALITALAVSAIRLDGELGARTTAGLGAGGVRIGCCIRIGSALPGGLPRGLCHGGVGLDDPTEVDQAQYEDEKHGGHKSELDHGDAALRAPGR